MKHRTRRLFLFSLLALAAIFISATSDAAVIGTHIIRFGGTNGYSYSPNSMNVLVGDTIMWVGDFKFYSFEMNFVPSGAQTIGRDTTGDTLKYIVKVPGEYNYRSNKFVGIGMSGSFIATIPKYGLTNEGREFYLAMLYPSYNSVAPSPAFGDFTVSALISTHYDNEVRISYADQSGKEIQPITYSIAANTGLNVPLNYQLMRMDTATDAASYKACHITSKYPVTVFYLSLGACAGGSYLALPILGLRKNYVASCYNDNPGEGAYLFTEISGGTFIVIATEDATSVKITPATTTVTGHPGANTGSVYPYTIILNKGQCYLARSNGRNADNDLSGSLIESTKPVSVISGHENAFLGGVDQYSTEGRNLLLQQMIPLDFWDSTGYVSIPFAEGSPSSDAGHGDTYRMYCFDNSTLKAHLDVQGINGGYDFLMKSLSTPPQKTDVTSPVEAFSPDGKKICLMQYDQRSVPQHPLWAAPSMMTIVPITRWRSFYSFLTTNAAGGKNDKDFYSNDVYVNVIAQNLANITLSLNGAPPIPLSSLARKNAFTITSSHFESFQAAQYRLINAAYVPTSYAISSTDPFMVYYYGTHDFAFNKGALGNMEQSSGLNIISEFSSPAGMQLNTGVPPSFIVDTTSTCSGWHICVRDTGANDPGLKAVILIDDPDAIYWQQPGAKYSNVSFDQKSADYYDASELHPHVHSNSSYCFDVNFESPLAAASAPLAIVDNLGNAIILKLQRSASALKLSTNPPSLGRADSIVFPVKKIGDEICTTFVFKNSAPKGGTPLALVSASFSNSDASYKVKSVTPQLPVTLAPQDSLLVQVCYTPLDSSRHRDSLLLKTDCFSLAVSLDAHGSTGLISANDQDFAQIAVGKTSCKSVLIRNIGSAPFTLTKQFILSDTINYSVDESKLPITIKEGTGITVSICFHPQSEGSFNAAIEWGTDLEASFAHSVKSNTVLNGTGIPAESVKPSLEENSFSIYPNPSNGNTIVVSFASEKNTHPRELAMFDVLGREVYHQNILSDISRLEIPIRDLPEGMYYVKLIGAEASITEKFLKVK
ncbi:MAG: T9SS type A sorting domain-containing protein [Ignavibacteriota bacterium]